MRLRPLTTTVLATILLACALGCGDEPAVPSDDEPRDRPAASNELPDPAGEGTDPDELPEPGSTIRVDGLAYTPQITRQLNSNIEPDRAFVDGREPPPDETWLGVFIRVCNEQGPTRTSSDRLAVVDAFGKRITPTELPESNPFGYDPEPLAAEECQPSPGSVSDRVIEGSLVLFSVPYDFLGDRPVALEVVSDSGERRRVALDL